MFFLTIIEYNFFNSLYLRLTLTYNPFIFLHMTELSKIFIVLGIAFMIAGIFIHFFSNLPLGFFGNLPGDIKIEKENFKFYFPLTTSIIISILLSILLFVINIIFKQK